MACKFRLVPMRIPGLRKGQEGEVDFSTGAEGVARTGPALWNKGFAPPLLNVQGNLQEM